MQNIDIFIAYSQADITQVKELEKHLAALERTYPVKIWYDGMVEAGKDWEAEVNAAMDRAEIILLMISSDFIASDFWYEKAVSFSQSFSACNAVSGRAFLIVCRICGNRSASSRLKCGRFSGGVS